MKKYDISIKWLSVTCFEIRCGDVTVVSDPFVTDCDNTPLTYEAIENCDIICLSHAHFDHITDIPALFEKFNPIVLCGDQTAMPLVKWLDCSPARVYPMHPDTELDFDKVKIRALYGRHTEQGKSFSDQLSAIYRRKSCSDEGVRELQPIGCLEYRNFFLTFPNGTTVLIWGNDPTPEQKNICKALRPDIALIQRPGSLEDLKSKARFAADIGCSVVIPHHLDFPGVTDTAKLELFKEEYAKLADGCFIIPNNGEWMEL